MIEKITLRIFWTAMLICAGTVLTVIWGGEEPALIQMKIVGTSFVTGFASFLIWAPLMVYRFLYNN